MTAQHKLRLSVPFIALLAMLLPAAASAGGTATIMSGGDTMHLAWQDNGAVRMQTDGQSDYLIMRDGAVYSVSTHNGQPRVIDLSGMIRMYAAMAGKARKTKTPFGRVQDIAATGASETIAGIEGRVYKITMTKPNGQTRTKELVLTDNPLVVSMTQAYVDALLGTLAPKIAAGLKAALPADDRGLLRSGDDEFVLTAISDDEPAAARFKLPAKPTSLGQMVREMMQKQQQ